MTDEELEATLPNHTWVHGKPVDLSPYTVDYNNQFQCSVKNNWDSKPTYWVPTIHVHSGSYWLCPECDKVVLEIPVEEAECPNCGATYGVEADE